MFNNLVFVMKNNLIFIIILSTLLFANQIDNIKNLISDKNYNLAFEECLKKINNDEQSPFYRYLMLKSAAGMNLQGQIDDNSIIDINNKLYGKKIRFEPYKLSDGSCSSNCINYMKNNPAELYLVMTAPDSKERNAIIALVYITLNNNLSKEKFLEYAGKNGVITGTIDRIELKGNMYKRFSVYIKNAELKIK